MAGQRLYGLPAPQVVTTGANGTAAVSWPAMVDVPSVQLTVENDSGSLGAFAEVVKGSLTKTGCTVRAWRLQMIPAVIGVLGANPAAVYAGATVHVRPWGTLA